MNKLVAIGAISLTLVALLASISCPETPNIQTEV